MRTSADVTVNQPVDAVWALLTDVDGVLAAIPGAALTRDGDAVSGSLKCKLGSTQITYRITVRAEVGQPEFHSAVLTLTGKEARGSGTVDATLTVALRSEPPATRLEVSGDIEATGRGENAREKDWTRVIQPLVNALVPRPEPSAPSVPSGAAKSSASAAAARPPLAVAPPLPDSRPAFVQRPDRQRQLGFALAAVGLLLLLRVIRRRRRG
jgi:carbon monoxide dehydrogenase subunit G